MAYTLVPTELIVDGAVTSAKLDTNISISGTLGVTGELTLSTHMIMGDNDKIKIGTGGDLEIYHDGSNSYISNSTGNIYLADTNGSVHIQAKLNEESIVCTADGAVTLYHDNAVKLATSSSGIDVTGTATMDGLDITENANARLYSSDGIGEVGSGNFAFQAVNSAGNALKPLGFRGEELRLATNKEALRIANNGDISFYEDTGTTAKFFWDASAESLGIGTTSPVNYGTGSQGLTINGSGNYQNLNLQVDGTTQLTIYTNGTSGTFINQVTADPMMFYTSDTERMRINAAGGLSINDDVENGLNLNRTTTTTGASYMKFTNGGGNYYLGADSSAGDRMAIGGQAYGFTMTAESGRPIVFATSNTARMAINSAGKVGIGESDPSNAKLEILQAGDHDAHSTHGIAIHSTGNTNFTSMYMGCEDAIDSAYIQSVALDGSFTSKSLLLNANGGNVGVGVTDPEKKLEVKSDTTYDGILIDVLSAPEIRLRDRGNSDTLIGTGRHGLDGFHIDTYSGNALFIRGSDRQVGIGTSSPQELIHAYSSSSTAIRASGGANNNKKVEIGYDNTNGPYLKAGSSGIIGIQFYVDNTTLAGKFDTNADFYTNDGTVHSLSDSRVKTDINDLVDGLDVVKQLQPKTFKYNEKSEFYNEETKDEVRYGFIADEVQEVAPQYMQVGKGKIDGVEVDDLKSLSTTKMIPMLVKAIQEQQTIIDDLKSRIETLEG